jgi:HK97 family phage major capsid protein
MKVSAILRSIEERPPTHFMVIRKDRGANLTDPEFRDAVDRFFKALKKRLDEVEYLKKHEWKHGYHHLHVLLIAPGGIPRDVVRAAAKTSGGLIRVTCRPIENPVGALRYVFKQATRQAADLTPEAFAGKLYSYSRGFLVRPLKRLWREFLADRPVRPASAEPPAPGGDHEVPEVPAEGGPGVRAGGPAGLPGLLVDRVPELPTTASVRGPDDGVRRPARAVDQDQPAPARGNVMGKWFRRMNKTVQEEVAKVFGPSWWKLGPDVRRSYLAAGVATGRITLPGGVAGKYLRGLARTKAMSAKRTKQVQRTKVTPDSTAGRLWSAAKVKDAGARLSTKRFSVKRPDGNPLTFGAKALETPSEYDNALIGVWWKTALRRLGVPAELTEWERSLLAESVTKDRWVGTCPDGSYYGGGGPSGFAPSARVKALLDDTVSGGLFLNPVVLDESIVTRPLLHSQLFQYVDLVPVTGRRVTTPVIENMTLTWGQAAGTAVQPMSTAALVSSLDTAVMPVAGFLELSNELQLDSPVDVGATVVRLFGERLKAELDRVIAVGNGSTEPLGIANATGIAALTADNSSAGPPTVSDAEALVFAVSLQYRQMDLSPAFVGNDTSYRRWRGISVGPADERRVFGMDEQSYQLLEYPFRVANDLPNNKVFFGCLKKFRLFQRLGMEVIREAGGRTLVLSNTQLIGLRARFGGRVVDGNAFSSIVDFQA